MKTILMAILLFSSVNLYAEAKKITPVTNQKDQSVDIAGSPYEDLERRMSRASMGNYFREDNALWSGRCFARSNPHAPIAAALLFRLSESDTGPIGPNIVYAASLWYPGGPTNHYDNKYISDFDNVTYRHLTPVSARNAHTLQLSPGLSAIRRDSQYIYEAIMDEHTNYTSYLCYYFIRNK